MTNGRMPWPAARVLHATNSSNPRHVTYSILAYQKIQFLKSYVFHWAVTVLRGIGRTCPPQIPMRQKFSKKNGMKLVYLWIENYVKIPPPPFHSDFSDLAPPLSLANIRKSDYVGLLNQSGASSEKSERSGGGGFDAIFQSKLYPTKFMPILIENLCRLLGFRRDKFPQSSRGAATINFFDLDTIRNNESTTNEAANQVTSCSINQRDTYQIYSNFVSIFELKFLLSKILNNEKLDLCRPCGGHSNVFLQTPSVPIRKGT